MSLLLTPWFWVGAAALLAAVAGAWFASHPSPEPLVSGRPQDTKHDHSEYVDDYRP